MALRGDAPKGADRSSPIPRALPIRSSWSRRWRHRQIHAPRRRLSRTATPMPPMLYADVQWLKRKLDAGAAAPSPSSSSRRHLPALPRPPARRGHHRPDHPRHSADHKLGRREALCRPLWHQCAPRLDEAFQMAVRDGREDLLALTHCTDALHPADRAKASKTCTSTP